MQTQTQTLTIKHWNQLTREQLEYVLTEQDRVKTYLYLMGLRIETDNILPDFGNSEDITMEEYGEWLDTIEELLSGKKICLKQSKAPSNPPQRGGLVDTICRWLRLFKHKQTPPLGGGGEGFLYADAEDLAYASIEQLKWLDTDHSLLSLPFETMKIGRHEYKMPDALMINTTYQQYSNAQGYMMQYWRILKQTIPPTSPDPSQGGESEDTGTSSVFGSSPSESKPKRKRKQKPWTPPTEEQLVQYAKQMIEARNGFLASILTPYRWKVKPHYPFLFREPLWDADSEKEIKADMAHAPSWLFDALYKQWQDNIKHFSKKFPDMFSEAKEDPKHDAFIAELGTINLVIEKGGYNNAAAVYNENCVFIFKLLNDQIKEAKELERIQKQTHSPTLSR